MDVISGKQRRPRRVLLYGPHGWGKSTWASFAPKALFLPTEDGLADIDCNRTPLVKTLGEFNGYISDILRGDHKFGTVVIDTLDWLEKLIWQQVAEEKSVKSIDDIPYYRGYRLANTHWDFILKSLDHIRNRGMAIILLAHARAAKVEPPDSDSYSRYEPDLYKEVAPMLQEWCDEVLFGTYKRDVIHKDEGFEKKRSVAIGDGTRVVYTREMPTHLAKRRIELPDEMPADFRYYAVCVAKEMKSRETTPLANGDIVGIVQDGSSKPKQEETING